MNPPDRPFHPRRVLVLAACLCLAACATATASRVDGVLVDSALPPYAPQPIPADSATNVFGYNDMRELLEPLVERFAATHGGLRVGLDLPGTRFAPAALAANHAALAPMGAELTPAQRSAYRAEAGHEPIEFRVAHASLDPRALSGPLAVFVQTDNPVVALTLEQLARAFDGRATYWGELGVAGTWADRPIRLYGVQLGSPLGYAMQGATHAGAAFGTGMTGLPQSAEVVAKVGADPLGLGYAAAMRAQPGVRMVPIAPDAAHDALLPSVATISTGRYPLDRYLLVYARRPLTPFAREFMRLMLSREGQQAVAATPQRYLPLSAAEAAVERAKLDAP